MHFFYPVKWTETLKLYSFWCKTACVKISLRVSGTFSEGRKSEGKSKQTVDKIFPNSPIDLQISKQAIFDSDKDFFSHKRRTIAAKLLAEHVGISPILSQEAWEEEL